MLEEIKKYKVEHQEDDIANGYTMGMFCPTAYITRNDIAGNLTSNIWGTIFLNLQDLKEYGDEIIIHECAHAVFSYDQNILRLNTGYEDMEIQEHYCYMHGEMIKAVRKVLKDNYKWQK
jgi:hypothetical protein